MKNTEDGSKPFFRKVGRFLQDNTASHAKDSIVQKILNNFNFEFYVKHSVVLYRTVKELTPSTQLLFYVFSVNVG